MTQTNLAIIFSELNCEVLRKSFFKSVHASSGIQLEILDAVSEGHSVKTVGVFFLKGTVSTISGFKLIYSGQYLIYMDHYI